MILAQPKGLRIGGVEGDSNILSQATNASQWAKPTDLTLVDRAIASTTYAISRHQKSRDWVMRSSLGERAIVFYSSVPKIIFHAGNVRCNRIPGLFWGKWFSGAQG